MLGSKAKSTTLLLAFPQPRQWIQVLGLTGLILLSTETRNLAKPKFNKASAPYRILGQVSSALHLLSVLSRIEIRHSYENTAPKK